MDVFKPIRRFDRFQQRHKPLAVTVATANKFSYDQATSFAVAVAFYTFFSIFPLLLVFMTVLGYVLSGDHSLMISVRDSVLGRFPVIGQSLQHDRLHGSALALTAGIALSLWASLGVTGAMTTALDHVWQIPRQDRASFVTTKLRGLMVLFAVGLLFVIATGASGIVTSGLGGGTALQVFGVIVSFLVNVVVFLIAFTFLCSAPPPWRKLLPGAIAAGVMWTVLQLLGGLYHRPHQALKQRLWHVRVGPRHPCLAASRRADDDVLRRAQHGPRQAGLAAFAVRRSAGPGGGAVSAS